MLWKASKENRPITDALLFKEREQGSVLGGSTVARIVLSIELSPSLKDLFENFSIKLRHLA